MATAEVIETLQARILAGARLIFLQTWEEARWQRAFRKLSQRLDCQFVVWSSSHGPQPSLDDAAAEELADPEAFLRRLSSYPADCLFVLKDFHPYLQNSRIVRLLRDLLPELVEQRKTLLFLGAVNTVPVELQKDAIASDLPLPALDDLRSELSAVLKEHDARQKQPLKLTGDDEGRLLTAVSGLTSGEARRAWSLALQGRDAIDDEVFAELVAEKKTLLQGSQLLEFYDLEEGLNDIGGLEHLKEWLAGRSVAFGLEAREQGLPMPKGVFLLGVQGCGKSLTARATARLLSFPLVRLDVAQLLSSDRGSSEQNMREVLQIAESMSPVVLWLDEIEKGFAGSAEEGDFDATMSRLIGQFLIWMEEKKAPVFVVATANSIANLPPELLRRGRFDEMFFIDLPNYAERKDILRVHLKKHGWDPASFAVAGLAERAEGYSGAELAEIVNAASVDSYVAGAKLSQKALDDVLGRTVPLSVTMEEKVFALREWARDRCRLATPDARISEMIERDRRDERKKKQAAAVESSGARWEQLAESGKLPEAICEYVGAQKDVAFFELQAAFADALDAGGDQGLALRSDPNAVIGSGMSGELAGLLSKLLRANRLYVSPVDESRYEKHTIKLPVIHYLPDELLQRASWLPVVLTAREPQDHDSRLSRVARIKLSR
jgi:hypothetical protein